MEKIVKILIQKINRLRHLIFIIILIDYIVINWVVLKTLIAVNIRTLILGIVLGLDLYNFHKNFLIKVKCPKKERFKDSQNKKEKSFDFS